VLRYYHSYFRVERTWKESACGAKGINALICPMDKRFDTTNFKEAILGEMNRTGSENRLGTRGSFVCDEFLLQLFSERNLRRRLGKDLGLGWFQSQHLSELVTAIRDRGRKLYAVLVLLDSSSRIDILINGKPAVDDGVLFGRTQPGPVASYCTLQNLEAMIALSDLAQGVYAKQWIFLPQLSCSETLEFPVESFMLPFANFPRKLGSGGAASVYKVDIPEGCIETDADYGSVTTVAYKNIREDKRGDDGWGRIMNEVRVLRARRNPNVVPLLASFIAGLEEPPKRSDERESRTRCLYLLSPVAEMDMDKWMWLESEPKYVKDFDNEDQFQKHIHYDAMLGLISGLTYIHREIGGDVGYHGDVKTKNILLFKTSGTREWTWKICDFGCSNLKSVKETATSTFVTSWYWAPLEFFLDRETDQHTHGRAHDIFSLGCVFLLLATISTYRWQHKQGLGEFKNRREQHDTHPPELISHAPGDRGAFYKSMDAVRSWIDHLNNSADCTTVALLEIVREMIRCREERIFAWEVEVDFYAIVMKAYEPKIKPKVLKKKTIDRLSLVIQESRDVDWRMKHRPYVRADVRGRSADFLDILKRYNWFEHTPGTTRELPLQAKGIDEPLSTLPTPLEDEQLFGNQDVIQRISDRFKQSDVVALYGLGGVGKTRIAETYAFQFTRSGKEIVKRHTFRVCASTLQSLRASYEQIGAEINGKTTTTSERLNSDEVKTWLEDKANGIWFMVVDGLDFQGNCKEIKAHLPALCPAYHQMLITTRNRALVTDMAPSRKEACIEISPLDTSISLRIFQYHIDKALLSSPSTHTEVLVKFLRFPNLIKQAAIWMNDQRMTTKQMKDDLLGFGFSEVEESIHPDYLGYLLKPITTKPSQDLNNMARMFHLATPFRNGDIHLREMRVLFLLSFFDCRAIDSNLLDEEYVVEDRTNFRKILAKLENCSFIHRRDADDRTIYSVELNVQQAVVSWVKRNEGSESLFKYYDRGLCMMFKCYEGYKEKVKNKGKKKSVQSRGSSHVKKLPFEAHFEKFVTFAKENKVRKNLKLHDRAVRAITIFSHVLLDKNRHDDAILVLEFAQERSPLQAPSASTQSAEQRRCRIELRRHLITVYFARPIDTESNIFYERADELIKELLQEVEVDDACKVEWEGISLVKWELFVEQFRLYWEWNRFEKAQDVFKRLERVKLRVQSGKPELPRPDEVKLLLEKVQSKAHDPPAIKHHIKFRLQKLAIDVKREEGLFLLARGDSFSMKNDSESAIQSWLAAKKSFKDAETAIKEWSILEKLQDQDPLKDIEIYIAEADIHIGTSAELENAREALQRKSAEVRQHYGPQSKRLWDLECKLNAARLKGNTQIQEAVTSSRQSLEFYEEVLGSNNNETIKCADLRRQLLVKSGKIEDADALLKRYTSLPPISNGGKNYFVTGSTLAMVVIGGAVSYQLLR
jgi:serine/threonine protein kinase